MKISVITWDASFRESYHTVDSFNKQSFPHDNFEFIWVEFYRNESGALKQKLGRRANNYMLNLDKNPNDDWHLGMCMNAGAKYARGEILVLIDGDIVVSTDFLHVVEKEFRDDPAEPKVVYFRRWNEPKSKHDPVKSYDLEYLREHCVLNNATNYGGAFAVRKSDLMHVQAYEEHKIFCGAGANAYELYNRFRNAAYSIKWSNEKVFHPYHNFSETSDKLIKSLITHITEYRWLLPSAGVQQSWVIYQRSLDLSTRSDSEQIELYLNTVPAITSFSFRKRLLRRSKSVMRGLWNAGRFL